MKTIFNLASKNLNDEIDKYFNILLVEFPKNGSIENSFY